MDIDGQAALPMSLGKSLHFAAHTAGKLAEAQVLDWQSRSTLANSTWPAGRR